MYNQYITSQSLSTSFRAQVANDLVFSLYSHNSSTLAQDINANTYSQSCSLTLKVGTYIYGRASYDILCAMFDRAKFGELCEGFGVV